MTQKAITVLLSGTGPVVDVSGFPVPRTFVFRGVSINDIVNIEVSQDNSTWTTLRQVKGPDPGVLTVNDWFAYVRAKRIGGTGACTLVIGGPNLTENDSVHYNFQRNAASNEDTDAVPVIVARVKEPMKLLNGFFALRQNVTTDATDYFTIAIWTKAPSMSWTARLEYIVQNAALLKTEFYGFNPLDLDWSGELPENSLIGYTVTQFNGGMATPDIYFQLEGQEFVPNS